LDVVGGHWLWAHIVYGSECWGQVCRKCGLLGVLQSQAEDFALFNVQEWRKYGQDEAAICLQAFVPGIAVLHIVLLELWCDVCDRPLMSGCPHLCLLIFARSCKR
jgi:hypothetical protein